MRIRYRDNKNLFMSVLLLDGDARNYAIARYFALVAMIILFITE